MIYKKILRQARDEIWQSWRISCAESADYARIGFTLGMRLTIPS